MAKGLFTSFFNRCDRTERDALRLRSQRERREQKCGSPERATTSPASTLARTHAEQVAEFEAWVQSETPVARAKPRREDATGQRDSRPSGLQRGAPVGGCTRKNGGAKRRLELRV